MKYRLQTLINWVRIGLPKSLERQIMLFGAICLVITIVSYGSYVAHNQTKAAKESIAAQMMALAQNLAAVDAHFLQTNEPASIEVLTLHTATVPGIFSILVTDTNGKPLTEVVNKNGSWSPRYFVTLAKVPDLNGPKTVFETHAYDSTHRDFLAGQAGTLSAWHRIEADQPLGWVRVSYRLDEFDLISANIRSQSYKVMALAIAAMLLLLTLLLRQPLRALREATEFANTLDNTQGNTLKVSNRTLEIEALGKALNAVSSRLNTQITDINNQKFALDQHAIVSITDLNGIITYANQRFCDISGFSQAELIGQNHRIVKSDEHPPEMFEAMWHTITQGKTWNGDVKNRKKDGSFYWVNATIVPLLDSNGLPHHYIGIRTDITANKLLEQHLQSARDEAEAATQAKARFLANMSHEIRTPMNAILGMLKLIQNTELDKRQQDYASKAEGAAQSLLGLINDILDFSKIDAGKMTLEMRNFRLDKLMRDLSVIVSSNLGAKPVEVLFDIDPAAPRTLMGDALRLQQVLVNLTGNAIKFTLKGEVVISITQMEHTPTHTSLRFTVRDSGIGIAPEHQQHIFNGFSQAETSTTRRFGGTGLGLSISRKLVTLMGGNLELKSAPGQGSAFSFTITLPIATDSAPQALPLPANMQVLVVDDNASAREILTSMAESLGWQADTAENGAAAVALLQARVDTRQPPYQAIFIDWQMPGMDGWETMEQLEAINTDKHPPIVVMVTAQGRDMLNQRSPQEQARLHGFLVKPVTASMLLDAVADALANRTQPTTTSAPVVKAKPLQGMRLLVVEDNIINQQVALEMLRGEGAQVSLADNGQLGVNAVHQAQATDQPFDAVLMDIQMPVMDGYNATRVLRQDPALAHLPIIAMTANAMASDREACLAVGMNEHVGKPFNLTQLVDLLQKLVCQAATRPLTPNTGTLKTSTKMGGVAPPEPALPPQDAIDVAAALERLSGNEALYGQVLKTYLRDLATQPEQLERCLEQADLAAACRLLHTLKGLSATVG
ncbi:MAG: kinase-like protein, partial [Comamonadaceae bacterium]